MESGIPLSTLISYIPLSINTKLLVTEYINLFTSDFISLAYRAVPCFLNSPYSPLVKEKKDQWKRRKQGNARPGCWNTCMDIEIIEVFERMSLESVAGIKELRYPPILSLSCFPGDSHVLFSLCTFNTMSSPVTLGRCLASDFTEKTKSIWRVLPNASHSQLPTHLHLCSVLCLPFC